MDFQAVRYCFCQALGLAVPFCAVRYVSCSYRVDLAPGFISGLSKFTVVANRFCRWIFRFYRVGKVKNLVDKPETFTKLKSLKPCG